MCEGLARSGSADGTVVPHHAYNALTAALALAGSTFYVLVYTRLLKHSTAQNIVIGGAAGAVQPLVVARGPVSTTRQILLYTVALTAATLAAGIAGTFSTLYLAVAVLLDAVFIALALRLWRENTGARAALLFHYSLLYLALLFIALAVAAVA